MEVHGKHVFSCIDQNGHTEFLSPSNVECDRTSRVPELCVTVSLCGFKPCFFGDEKR